MLRGNRFAWAVAVIALVTCLNGCALFLKLDTARTGAEKSLLPVAREVRLLARTSAEDPESADDRVAALLSRARKIWADSPSRSASVIGGEDTGYEMGIALRAAADYYVASGRPGRALPLLEEASREALALRYYAQWQELTLELVGLYQRLGMIERARDEISAVLRFLERFGYTLATPPREPGRDLAIFLSFHAAQIETRPEHYTDAAIVRQLYALFEESTSSSVEAWGWSPSVGYRYVDRAAPFGIRLAELGDLDTANRIRSDVEQLHERNRNLDPFVFANERGLDSSMTRLGRDLHRLIERPFAAGVYPLTERIRERAPRERRYLERDSFVEHFELARLDLAIGDAQSALAEIELARARRTPLEGFYESAGPELLTQDGIQIAMRGLSRLRARVLETLGRCRDSERLYEAYVEWSERERESLSVAERIHFFRGQARAAYQGSIRCSLRRYLETRDPNVLALAVGKAERMRARGFQDLLGIPSDPSRPPEIHEIEERLEPGEALLQMIDLDSHVATIIISSKASRAQLYEKPSFFDRDVFRLRNRLAESADYDRDAFERLGIALLGFIAAPLAESNRLLVTVDGVLSSLPPGILPFAPNRLLHDGATATLIPSVALWLRASDDTKKVRPIRALVVGDPAFESESGKSRGANPDALALRGSASLAYFERLPETADEAEAVVSSLGNRSGGRLLLDQDATESRIKSDADLSEYTHIHLATHGVIGNDLPDLSEPALVLAWEPDEDGLLTATEVAALELDAQLTVLSACNTGNGEYFAGEGLMGMGRAFLLAGSDRVVVSLWPVESFSTQRLMELFYERLARGESEEQALWHAQRALQLESGSSGGGPDSERGISIVSGSRVDGPGSNTSGPRFSNPFYWSPFVLISAK